MQAVEEQVVRNARAVVHALEQGSEPWHAYRRKHYNASDAAAMLGCSQYKSRADFVRNMAMGTTPEISAETAALFARGHEIEAVARQWGAEVIGVPLQPMVLSLDVDGLPLSVSLDGITPDGWTTWECKSRNKVLETYLSRDMVPPEYAPQLEQGLFISGAERALLMCSDGTRAGTFWAWYESDPALRQRLIGGWKQFRDDVVAYQHEPEYIPAVAIPQAQLPTVAVKVEGQIIVRDNLAAFGDALMAYVERINRKPETDEDFATLEATVKTLKTAEEALVSAEEHALAQTESIDTLRRTVARFKEMARSNRLLAEKLVKAEKENRRATIITEGQMVLASRIAKINGRLGRALMPTIPTDFAGVCRGLKTIKSLKDAVDGELARATIEAQRVADIVADNLALVEGHPQHAGFFADLKDIIGKPQEDFAAIVQKRISDHQKVAIKDDVVITLAQAIPSSVVLNPRAPTWRPSDIAIVTALADKFQSSPATVLTWLEEMDLAEVRSELTHPMRNTQ